MNILRWIRTRRPGPSAETLNAKKRLESVRKDDKRIDATIAQRERIIRENHLGPAILKALKGE